MRSPALAIAWEFRQRHRWGLIAVAGYLLVLGTIQFLIADQGQPVDLDDSRTFAATVVVPLTSAFFYFLAIFSFGLAGDVAARQSMYPARMFTLPVTAAALAGWPMLYGTAAMASLWLVTARLALWPSGIDVPLWPALFAAAFLAWTQVLTWLPYGLTGLRVIVAALWLVGIDTIAVLAIHYQPAEAVMVAILAPQLSLAYLAARFAVARARRGDVPDWRDTFSRIGGESRMSCRVGETIFLRPRALKCGSSGGGMGGRCRRGWGSCCRSSWPCSSSPATTRPHSSSTICSAYCSLHPSWPRSPPRRSASRIPMGAIPMA